VGESLTDIIKAAVLSLSLLLLVREVSSELGVAQSSISYNSKIISEIQFQNNF
jgi:hypothetical protein